MVTWRGTTTTSKYGTGDNETIKEMWADMEEMRRHNQIFEDNVLNLLQHLHKVNPFKDINILDPRPLSNKY